MKYTSLAMLALGLSITLTSCSKDDNSNSHDENPATTQHSNDAKNVDVDDHDHDHFESTLPDDAPVIKVATEEFYAPFVMRDKGGHIKGSDIELLRTIGEEQGFKVAFTSLPFREVLPRLKQGDFDIALSGIPIDNDLLEFGNVSDPYLYDHLEIVTMSDKAIENVKGLEGKVIGAQQGTFVVDYVNNIKNSELNEKGTVFQLFESMVLGNSDAFIATNSASLYVAKEFPETQVNFADYDNKRLELAFYVNKDKTDLLKKVNTGLANLKKDGRYDQINKKWFGKDADKLMISN